MHMTFFVGNGFDISCGINSSYSDFYKWYFKQEKSDKAHINAFREAIKRDIEAGKENWSDFEEALGQYTENFTKDTAYEFVECYEDANANLMKYLGEELFHFENGFSDEEIKKFRDGLKTFYAELSPRENNLFEDIFKSHRGESSSIEFVSYNYTNVLDRIVSVAAKDPLDTWKNANGQIYSLTISSKIIHAHGRLNYHPIFGVNDENQIKNKALLEVPDFSTLLIKPRCVSELGELWHEEVDKRINNSSIICIYGMSMGITDTFWFHKITNWLRAENSRHLILYWYTKTPSDVRSNWQTLTNVRAAREKLIDHSDYTAQQIKDISPRIHVIENTSKVLQVKLQEKKKVVEVN